MQENEHCTTCGDPIGDYQAKNAVYYCDQAEEGAAWCGDCFAAVRCEEQHGEGCATLTICPASPKPEGGESP